MFLEANDTLFHKLLYNKTHVLHLYLYDIPETVYSLRTRSRNKSLISYAKISDLNDRNFLLIRAIYKDCY